MVLLSGYLVCLLLFLDLFTAILPPVYGLSFDNNPLFLAFWMVYAFLTRVQLYLNYLVPQLPISFPQYGCLIKELSQNRDIVIACCNRVIATTGIPRGYRFA